MINIVDKDIFKRMLATIVLLIIFSLPLIDKNTMFLFKETQKTHGIIKYIDLNENKVWVEELRASYPHKHFVSMTEKVCEIRKNMYEKLHG
jgi:hypothetical protein